MELSKGLSSRITQLKMLQKRKFETDHAITDIDYMPALTDQFNRALLKWEIDCLENDRLMHFSLGHYR